MYVAGGLKIPELEDSGSDGRQVEADSISNPNLSRSLAPSLARAIVGIANSNARAFGGEVASALLVGATSQMASELDDSKRELAAMRQQLQDLKRAVSQEKVQNAILAERIDSYRATRHIKNIVIAVGTLLIGNGFKVVTSESGFSGFAFIAVGGLFLLLGWYTAPKRGDK